MIGHGPKKLLYARDVAALLNSPSDHWDSQRARRWLQSSGLGFQLPSETGRPGKWATTLGQIARRQPELLDVLESDDGACPFCGEGGIEL